MGILAAAAKFILPGLFSVVDKVVPDPALNAQLKAQLQLAFLQADETQVQAAAGVVVAEAKSESWITASWRPITMLVFVTIIAFNYLVQPILAMFHVPLLPLPLPPDLWDLLKLGIGGYVVGRSAEKAVTAWKGGA